MLRYVKKCFFKRENHFNLDQFQKNEKNDYL